LFFSIEDGFPSTSSAQALLAMTVFLITSINHKQKTLSFH